MKEKMESVQIIAPHLLNLKGLVFILSLSWSLNRLRKKAVLKQVYGVGS